MFKLLNEIIKRFGKVDIAINTTGMIIKKTFTKISELNYDKVFAINSKTAFLFMQEASKYLID
ncbi:MAG: SDR family NAD(P)-dependent oxidoreductase [Flavobacteriales bacterium AspAUS03]